LQITDKKALYAWIMQHLKFSQIFYFLYWSSQRTCGWRTRKYSTRGSCSICSSAKYSTSYIGAHGEPADQGQESTLLGNYAASVVQPNVNFCSTLRKHSTRGHAESLLRSNILLPVLEHTENLQIKDKKTLYAGIMQHL
jgi:hypothetical protein